MRVRAADAARGRNVGEAMTDCVSVYPRSREGCYTSRMSNSPAHATRRLRVSVIVIGCALGFGCNDSPTIPSTAGLPLTAGIYHFSTIGPAPAFVNGTLVPGCDGSAPLTFVDMNVALEAAGPVWIGRPASPAAGDFEVRFEADDAAPPSPNGVGVKGTASGFAANTAVQLPPDLGVSFGGPGQSVTLDGLVSLDGGAGVGGLFGSVVFSDGQGRSASCKSGTAHWLMGRLL
jgi:hypothetical protein